MRFRLALALAALVSAKAFAAPEDIVGVWLTDDEDGAVQIVRCGDRRCGRIVWLKDPKDANGQPVRDAKNPDASLRSRPLCGLVVLSGLAVRDSGWDQGRIYDPDEGSTYDVAVRRDGPDALKVTGYVTFPALGRTVTWRLAPKDLGSCATAAPPPVRPRS